MRSIRVIAIGFGLFLPLILVGQETAKKAETSPTASDPAGLTKLMGLGADSTTPVTTEIYADEVFFDAAKYMGVFSGRVRISDPRFNLQADKLTVYMSKEKNEGLEKVIAEGKVGVVWERPNAKSGEPDRAVGRAERAVYTGSSGSVELAGLPRVQQGGNVHVATSKETVMILNQTGQLITRGPSRTEIRQPAKGAELKP